MELALTDDLPTGWERSIFRAYTVFGVEPLVAEFGLSSRLRSALVEGLRRAWAGGDPEWVTRSPKGQFIRGGRAWINNSRGPVKAHIGKASPNAAPNSPGNGTAPGATDPFGLPVEIPELAQVRQQIDALFAKLPADPASIALMKDEEARIKFIAEGEASLPRLQDLTVRAKAAREKMVTIAEKVVEARAAAKASGQRLVKIKDFLNEEELTFLEKETYGLFNVDSELDEERDDKQFPFILNEMQKDIAAYEQKLPDTLEEIEKARKGEGFEVPAIDKRDKGPAQQLVDALATIGSAGGQIENIIDNIMAAENITIMYGKVSPEQFEELQKARYETVAPMLIEAYNKHFPGMLSNSGSFGELVREIAQFGSVELAQTGKDLSGEVIGRLAELVDEARTDPRKDPVESVMNFLEREADTIGSKSSKLSFEIMRASALRGEEPGVEYAERRAQITRQVLRELGVEFGPPADVPSPYRRLRPVNSEAADEEERISGEPRQQVQNGDKLWMEGDNWEQVTVVSQDDPGSFLVAHSDGTQSLRRTEDLYYETPMPEAVQKSFDTALALMPTEYLRALWKDQPVIAVHVDTERARRSYKSVHVEPDTNFSTVIHEEHHGLEKALSWLKALQWAALIEATYSGATGSREPKLEKENESLPRYRPTPLGDLSPLGHLYESDEITLADDFLNPYMGKLYFSIGPNNLGGNNALTSHFEYLTMTAEDVLSGTPRDLYLSPYTSQPLSQRIARNHYLGQLLYYVNRAQQQQQQGMPA